MNGQNSFRRLTGLTNYTDEWTLASNPSPKASYGAVRIQDVFENRGMSQSLEHIQLQDLSLALREEAQSLREASRIAKKKPHREGGKFAKKVDQAAQTMRPGVGPATMRMGPKSTSPMGIKGPDTVRPQGSLHPHDVKHGPPTDIAPPMHAHATGPDTLRSPTMKPSAPAPAHDEGDVDALHDKMDALTHHAMSLHQMAPHERQLAATELHKKAQELHAHPAATALVKHAGSSLMALAKGHGAHSEAPPSAEPQTSKFEVPKGWDRASDRPWARINHEKNPPARDTTPSPPPQGMTPSSPPSSKVRSSALALVKAKHMSAAPASEPKATPAFKAAEPASDKFVRRPSWHPAEKAPESGVKAKALPEPLKVQKDPFGSKKAGPKPAETAFFGQKGLPEVPAEEMHKEYPAHLRQHVMTAQAQTSAAHGAPTGPERQGMHRDASQSHMQVAHGLMQHLHNNPTMGHEDRSRIQGLATHHFNAAIDNSSKQHGMAALGKAQEPSKTPPATHGFMRRVGQKLAGAFKGSKAQRAFDSYEPEERGVLTVEAGAIGARIANRFAAGREKLGLPAKPSAWGAEHHAAANAAGLGLGHENKARQNSAAAVVDIRSKSKIPGRADAYGSSYAGKAQILRRQARAPGAPTGMAASALKDRAQRRIGAAQANKAAAESSELSALQKVLLRTEAGGQARKIDRVGGVNSWPTDYIATNRNVVARQIKNNRKYWPQDKVKDKRVSLGDKGRISKASKEAIRQNNAEITGKKSAAESSELSALEKVLLRAEAAAE